MRCGLSLALVQGLRVLRVCLPLLCAVSVVPGLLLTTCARACCVGMCAVSMDPGLSFTARVVLMQGGEKFSMGKFLPGRIPPGKNCATIVKSDGKNCATLFHGEGQGLRSALLIEGDTT